MQERLNCVMDIGEQMISSGAEVHQVEDTVNRMCAALGAGRVDCFIITSSMVVTIRGENGEVYTETRRMQQARLNFQRLEMLHALAKRVCEGETAPEAIRLELARIKEKRAYPLWAESLMYAVIAAAFAVFFGGSLVEGGVAALIGLAVRFAVWLSDKVTGNVIFTKFLSAFSIAALTHLVVFWGWIPSPDQVIIGNIMLIIPGLGFTNALRDLFIGDSIAGSLRFLEAALSAVAIAAGYFAFIFLTGGILL